MATYTIDQYQKVWMAKAKMLKKAAKKSSKDASSFMVATAKGMAPSKTGVLREGIKARPIKGGAFEVSSVVPTMFPYQFWINQTAPYRRVRMRWNQFAKTVYGDGSHMITGTPRYWHLATLRTMDVLGRIARENIRKALRVRIL